jgi:hypothetical protein
MPAPFSVAIVDPPSFISEENSAALSHAANYEA